MKEVIGGDIEGGLYLTYWVSVASKGKAVLNLGGGGQEVHKFYHLAKAGIPGAIKTEFLFFENVNVTLSGESLMALIRYHYPDLLERAEAVIDPEEEYVIDCYDMS